MSADDDSSPGSPRYCARRLASDRLTRFVGRKHQCRGRALRRAGSAAGGTRLSGSCLSCTGPRCARRYLHRRGTGTAYRRQGRGPATRDARGRTAPGYGHQSGRSFVRLPSSTTSIEHVGDQCSRRGNACRPASAWRCRAGSKNPSHTVTEHHGSEHAERRIWIPMRTIGIRCREKLRMPGMRGVTSRSDHQSSESLSDLIR